MYKMSGPLANAARLKPEIRLAQAVSRFEADLSHEEKRALQTQKLELQSSPPDQGDVMRLTAQIDKPSGIAAGRRCFGPRLTSFLDAVQQFAALGDVIVGGSQNLIACGVWVLVRLSLLVSFRTTLLLTSKR
jgi:ankyrin repeat domain-containing protein 50